MRILVILPCLLMVAACDNTIAPAVPGSLEVFPAQVMLDAINASTGVGVALRDVAGGDMPKPSVMWTARNAAVATVDASGVVMARGQGETWVVAEYGGEMKDSTLVRVRARLAFAARLRDLQNPLLAESAVEADASVVVHRPVAQ